MSVIKHTIFVNSLPTTNAWQVMLDNGNCILEGQNGINWTHLDIKKIVKCAVLHVILPPNAIYAFHREGMASFGKNIVTDRIVARAMLGNVCLEYNFVRKK